MMRMVNPLQNTIRMLDPLGLACEHDLTGTKLLETWLTCTCSQDTQRITKLFDAADATRSVLRSLYV